MTNILYNQLEQSTILERETPLFYTRALSPSIVINISASAKGKLINIKERDEDILAQDKFNNIKSLG